MALTSMALSKPIAKTMRNDKLIDSPDHKNTQMNALIWLNVGHVYEPLRCKEQNWSVWVRGIAGADITALVDKVDFQLRPETQFRFPNRVIKEPPYQVEGVKAAPTEVHINIYLKGCTKPERIQLKYSPSVSETTKSGVDSRCIYYDVQNPSEKLRMLLMKSTLAKTDNASHLEVLPNSVEVHSKPQHSQQSTTKRTRCESVAPKDTQPPIKKKRLNKCPPCEQFKLDCKNLIRLESSLPKLTENELEHVSQMTMAHMRYQNSATALPLPPLSDPIFDLPKLPPSLRRARALYGVKVDYALQ